MKKYSGEILKMMCITALLIGVFSSLPIYIIQLMNQKQGMVMKRVFHIERVFLLISFLVLISWGVNVWLLNQYERRYPHDFYKKNSRYIVSSLGVLPVVFCTAFLIKLLFSDFLPPPPPVEVRFFPYLPVIGILATNLIVLIMLDLLVLRHKEAQISVENEQLKRLNVEAKYAQLQYQLQPHFLFNALATLNSLIKKQPSIAETYIFQLSHLLRSTLSTQNQGLVDLHTELNTAKAYLMLQNVRFDGGIQLDIDKQESFPVTGKLPHLALLTLVENAVKHNQFSKNKPLKIFIQVIDNQTLVVKNTVDIKPGKGDNTQIGLSNIRQRYSLISSGLDVVVSQDECFFQVNIPIIFH